MKITVAEDNFKPISELLNKCEVYYKSYLQTDGDYEIETVDKDMSSFKIDVASEEELNIFRKSIEGLLKIRKADNKTYILREA